MASPVLGTRGTALSRCSWSCLHGGDHARGEAVSKQEFVSKTLASGSHQCKEHRQAGESFRQVSYIQEVLSSLQLPHSDFGVPLAHPLGHPRSPAPGQDDPASTVSGPQVPSIWQRAEMFLGKQHGQGPSRGGLLRCLVGSSPPLPPVNLEDAWRAGGALPPLGRENPRGSL